MAQLRPHLDLAGFVPRIRMQQSEGFLLAALYEGNAVRAVAGYRFYHNLYSGHVLYVDDLVTDQNERSRGHGDRLLDWLVQQARDRDCDSFELDSGVQRHGAHRFYLLHRMDIVAYHFRLRLKPA
jgi:GNAT superfamily N-acetyltransferase